MKYLILFPLVLGFALVGCVSTPEVAEKSVDPKGQTTVVMKIPKDGSERSRAEAIAKAKEACGGGLVKLINESIQSANAGYQMVNLGKTAAVVPNKRKDIYLTFECIEAQTKPEIY